MIKLLLGALALHAAAQTSDIESPGPEARSAPLERVFPFWTDYLALAPDERDGFELGYVLDAPLQADGQSYSFWVETGPDQFRRLDIDGSVTPPGADAFEQGLSLYTDAPRGAVRVEMQLSLPGPPRTVYTRQELESALAQAGNAMRRSMGVRALFMPRLDTIRFVFDGPAPEADFITAQGDETPISAVFIDEVLVTPGQREMRSMERIRFARPPLYAVLETRD